MFEILSICDGGGYRYCRTNPPHPKRNSKGLYPLHRVLMEIKLNRLLLDGEDVHHIDENKENDDINNLEVKTKSEHAKYHHPEIDKIECICLCGNIFYEKPSKYRLRIKRSKSGKIYCSSSCGGKYSK